jgi:hypothetical protein
MQDPFRKGAPSKVHAERSRSESEGAAKGEQRTKLLWMVSSYWHNGSLKVSWQYWNQDI